MIALRLPKDTCFACPHRARRGNDGWRNIAIARFDLKKGEQKAHVHGNALISTVIAYCATPSYIGAVKKLSLGLVLFATVSLICQKAAPRPTFPPQPQFDAPVTKKVLKLPFPPGSWEDQQHFTIDVTCYFYRDFVIKEEYRMPNKGTDGMSIVPSTDENTCTASRVTGERVLWGADTTSDDANGWGGMFFAGAKGNLLFFEGDRPGGRDFVIYDFRNTKKVFSDSAYEKESWGKKVRFAPFDSWRIISAQDGTILLRYLRLEYLDCDLRLQAEKSACWESIKKKTGLKSSRIPVCTGYEYLNKYYRNHHYASVIAYPVEVSLLPPPTRRVIAGPVECWPVP